jgi:hypothetical protein
MSFPVYANVVVRRLRASRANPAFPTDEKHIRWESTVRCKDKNGAVLFLVRNRRFSRPFVASTQQIQPPCNKGRPQPCLWGDNWEGKWVT